MSDYYQTCAFPKTPTRKSAKKTNGWKNKADRICYYCGKRGAERHEVFNGPNRQKSIDLGFQVDLCQEHHRMMHESGHNFGRTETLKWRMFYQRQYEDKLIETGIKPEQAREMWMSLIGKSYI